MQNNGQTIVVAGAGIAGLGSALALSQAGFAVQLLEQAPALQTVGAGVQLGPNASRILSAWGLDKSVQAYAATPYFLVLRDMCNAHVLAHKRLYPAMQARFGTPYLTIHRADLQQLLLQALFEPKAGFVRPPNLALGQGFSHFESQKSGLTVYSEQGQSFGAGVLLGADGLWSRVRQQVLADDLPHYSGYVAYRACVQQSTLPQSLRSNGVSLWMGPGLHMVTYPVRQGTLLNVVLVRSQGVAQHTSPEALTNWARHKQSVPDASWLQHCAAVVQDLVQTVTEQKRWTHWPLFERPLMHRHDMAPVPKQAVALIGDAAHAMRPFLAQGAGMALEDAQALTDFLHTGLTSDVQRAQALQAFSKARFSRVRKVQLRSGGKARVYHAQGGFRLGRNLFLRFAGPWLLRQSWLYKPQ